MKHTYLFLTFLCAVILLPVVSQAQYIVDYKRQGDAYFSNKNYYAAAVYYQKALKLLPDTTGKTYFYPYSVETKVKRKVEKNAEKYQYLVYKLGQAFRFYNDFENAEKWYGKAIKFENDNFPLARLWYAVCLRADQKYETATEELKTFQSAYTKEDQYSKRASLELKSCKFAIAEMKYPRLSDMHILPAPINVDSGSNYAAVRIADTLYFTSSRVYKNINPEKHNPFINKIYKSVILSGGSYDQPKAMNLAEEKLTEVAASSFSPAHTRVYLTEWKPADKNEKEEGHYVITVSQRDFDGKLMPTEQLGAPVNIQGADTKEASITPDGKYLVFSSNRSGGSGGYDLWYCTLDVQGMPTGDAMNLGSTVNTDRDENNPYYNAEKGILVFSSNGRVGIGGFDLFKSKGSFEADSWSEPKNMSYPVNSSKDDNFYFPLEGEGNFYLSSDRNSVCCLELYKVHLKELTVTGHVYDKNTRAPLNHVKVIFTDSLSDNTLDTRFTNADGAYSFKVENKRPLKLNFSKDGYFAKNIMVPTSALRKVDTVYRKDVYLTAYEIDKPIIIPNVLYDFDKATLRPASKKVLDTLANILRDNPKMVVQMSAHTDSVGTDAYNMDLSQRRAQSCVDYLISVGINSSRISAKGYGETHPIAPNSKPDGSDNPEGRQKNRRTAFTVLKD